MKDPVEQRQIQLFQMLLVGLIVFALLALPISLTIPGASFLKPLALSSNVLTAVFASIALLIARRGYLKVAVFVAVIGMVLAFTIGLLVSSLRYSWFLMLAFALPLTLAVLLLGRRGLITVGLLSIGAVIGVVALERSPAWAAFFVPASEPTMFGSVGAFILIVVLLSLFLDRFGMALRDTFSELQSSNQRLSRELAERARIEQTLRDSEALYRLLAENVTDIISKHTLEGVYTYVSPSCHALLGYLPGALLGRSVYTFCHLDDLGPFQDAYVRALEDRKPVTIVYRMRGNDGHYAWLESTCRAIWDARTGAPVEMLMSSRDISARKRADEVLRASEAGFRLLFAANPQPMWVYDADTLAFLEVNGAAVARYGYTRAEFLRMTIVDIRPKEDVPRLMQFLETPRPNLRLAGEWRHQLRDGTMINVEVTSHALEFSGRKAVLVVAQDITERKKLQAQLTQAQRMESVGRLAGGVAHDFNNLLTAISSYSELALNELEPADPIRDDLHEIQKAAERATGLTRQLLAFARKQPLEPQVLNLNSLILDMDRLLRRVIGADIELVTLPDSDLGSVKADPGQIEQVIMNLVVNSRDAMPDGGKLTIETKNVLLGRNYINQHLGVTAGAYILLAISDTGCGMNEEIRRQVFEPFFTTKPLGQGTGLGLATCYGIIKQHGGNIWVYSEVQQGTTFKIYLPRVDDVAGELMRYDSATVLPRGNETVLLVEDEEAVRALAARVLRMQGYTILEAANGDEALRVVQEFQGSGIDLLLTDVVMPRMGGRVLAERLRAIYPAIKVLFTSGYTDTTIIHYGRLDPGILFLQKPFSPAALARKVREVLDL